MRRPGALAPTTPDRELTAAVNVSPHALSNPVLPTLIAQQLTNTGLPADALVLEITEAALATDHAHADANTLRRLGIHISIDDFGAEHSTLARLAQLPADIIKLDASLLPAPDESSDEAPILRALINLADKLGKTLIAEGVETPHQLQLLRRYGCATAQGYLLARPQPARDIDRLLDTPLTPTT